jgi:hypothetical protein
MTRAFLAFEVPSKLVFDPANFLSHFFGDDIFVFILPDGFGNADVFCVKSALLPC